MKLIASMMVKDELSRYLRWTVPALLEFCDAVYAWDDGSQDDSYDWLSHLHPRVHASWGRPGSFDQHEGRARQALLEWTLMGDPTHILAIDADEFVADGAELRRQVERMPQAAVWSLVMQEVWEAYDECLCVRVDGGWRPHPTPCLYRVPDNWAGEPLFQIADKQLACGREPLLIRRLSGYARDTGTEILHFGWANRQERQARYDRYMTLDGGRFHNHAHLQSIMHGPVELAGRPWPDSINQAGVHARVNQEGAPAA